MDIFTLLYKVSNFSITFLPSGTEFSSRNVWWICLSDTGQIVCLWSETWQLNIVMFYAIKRESLLKLHLVNEKMQRVTNSFLE